MSWKDLSIREKASIIRDGVANGIYNIREIKNSFNRDLENFKGNDANFVQRLRDNDTRYIQNEDGSKSTHRLGYVIDGDSAIIYPEIQDNNGSLEYGTIDSAIERGDTVRTSIPFAKYYTENYKRDYPEFFNKFDGKNRSNWLQRITSASIMNDPYTGAVAQASGWNMDSKTGVATQGDPNEDGAKRLADSLYDISIIPLTDVGIGAIGSAISGTKLYKSYKFAKELNKVIRNSNTSSIEEVAPRISEAFERSYDFPSKYPTTVRYNNVFSEEYKVPLSRSQQNFVKDVNEAVNWATHRGKTKAPIINEVSLSPNEHIASGAEARVFNDPNNNSRVLKEIYSSHYGGSGSGFDSPEEAISFAEESIKSKNSRPYNLRQNIIGYTKNEYGKYIPVVEQNKVVVGDKAFDFDAVGKFSRRIGSYEHVPYSTIKEVPVNNIFYENDFPVGKDFKLQNIGKTSDDVWMGIDLLANGGDKNTINHPKYNAKQVNSMYDYLRENRLTNEQASGILGNLAVESYLNADMNQVGGTAYGLMQAEGDRQRKMKNYDKVPYSFGSGLTDEEQWQLDYIINEGMNNYVPGEWGGKGYSGARQARTAFLNADTTRMASDIITRNYLRPGKPAFGRRRAMSDYYYNTQSERLPYQIESWSEKLKSWEQ